MANDVELHCVTGLQNGCFSPIVREPGASVKREIANPLQLAKDSANKNCKGDSYEKFKKMQGAAISVVEPSPFKKQSGYGDQGNQQELAQEDEGSDK